MRIHYLALHEPSGYAEAARRCMFALVGAGAELRFVPLVPGHGWGLGYQPAGAGEIDDPSLAGLLAGPDDCDVVVAHLVPEYWPIVRARYPRALLVGQTVWETDRLPAGWPSLLDVADLVLVPTEWNRRLLTAAGVRRPTEVVPHIVATPTVATSERWSELPADAFVVYTIAPWTARKALELTVRAYLTAFSGQDDTLLVIKTSPDDLVEPGPAGAGAAARGSTAWSLARLLGGHPDPAAVRLVTRVLSGNELDALHTRGDCYLSLCRSEGWGIPPFDAAAFGNPVVITGYGGQLAYLDAASAFLVDHRIVPVEDPRGGASYTRDQHWAEPSVEHAAALLRTVASDPGAARDRAVRARDRVLREFDAGVVARTMLDAFSRSV
jgi:glycosyltransferase involved in cell wall biosynthesis